MRGSVPVAAAVLFAVAVGCAREHDTADAGETTGREARVTATLQRSTLFATHRSLRLTVSNGGDQELEIGAVQLSSPLFEPVPPQTRDVPVPASERVVIPLPFGTAQCDDVIEEPAELITQLDGDEVHVALDEIPSGVLSELHDAECAATAVLTSVDLHLGDTWERTATRTIEGEVELTQRSSGVTAAVDEVRGNVIFGVSTTGPRVEVTDERPSAAGQIAITAARCDPHALIEYKRTFIFSAYVEVDGGEPTLVDIEAEGGARRALEVLLRSCIG
ncbi:MAG: hypothetical protein ACRD0V_08585 [Acidimicrobiales bacterium]